MLTRPPAPDPGPPRRPTPSRRPLGAVALVLLVLAFTPGWGAGEDPPRPAPQGGRAPRTPTEGPMSLLSQVLGRPTDRAVTLSVLGVIDLEAYVEVGTTAGTYPRRTEPRAIPAGRAVEIEIGGLEADTRYGYRLRTRRPGEQAFVEGTPCSFRTQRAPGSAFVFGVQGDSHPEREGRMFGADLYVRTLKNVAQDEPDLYLTMGDDFSIDPLIASGKLSKANVEAIYARQRGFLGIVGRSAALFLVNGNHEQAARVHLDGTATNPAVLAGNARIAHFPLPAPDAFYGGDAEPVEHIGLLRDYYGWTWGDALFLVLDPYWHSDVLVDAEVGGARGGRKGQGEDGGGKRGRDLWDVTLGEAQYQWLRTTLESSRARYVFVFTHHVLGTGRGGIERAGLFEWGDQDPRGKATFAERRPTWELPIHQLLAKHRVSVLFQAHDHLFAHQELDGVVYQSCPNPADTTYTAFNREAYQAGTVLPNSGHLRVSVAPGGARVEYVRAVLPGDEERAGARNGEVAFAYTVKPRPVATR